MASRRAKQTRRRVCRLCCGRGAVDEMWGSALCAGLHWVVLGSLGGARGPCSGGCWPRGLRVVVQGALSKTILYACSRGGRCGRLGTAGSGCPRGALLMICRLNTRAWFGCAYDQLPARCMGDVGSEQSPVVAAYPTSQTRKNKSGSTIRNNSNET